MKVIRPFAVTDAALTASNVAETDGVPYDAGASYGIGDIVVQDHVAYESLQAGSSGHAVTDAAWWLDLGATNRWKMFDQINGSETTNVDSIEVTVQVTGRADSVAVLNVSAANVRIIMTDQTDGVVHDETYSMANVDGIADWYAYFFEESTRKTDLVITGLPPYASPEIEVQILDPGETASVGSLVLGYLRDIGATVYGAQIGITDYSRKTADDFGNYIIVQRAFSKRGKFTVFVEKNEVDALVTLFSNYRATPIVWIGADDYSSTFMFGFYKDFVIEIAYPMHSIATLEIEGLT